MSQAVEAYRGVTATEEFRSLEWLRRKTEHDEAQAIYNAEKRRDEYWRAENEQLKSAVADKDALIAELQAKLAKNN